MVGGAGAGATVGDALGGAGGGGGDVTGGLAVVVGGEVVGRGRVGTTALVGPNVARPPSTSTVTTVAVATVLLTPTVRAVTALLYRRPGAC